ncbi:MAG TPA: Npt1/Npt2 family nucleotide transporter [Vicinamibacterales bacterium]|nr:Npt1/Npt2 family nucleotide transporter [Vicinamibacterales bacterium]
MPTGSAPQSSEPRTLVSHPELKSQQSLPVFKSLGEAKKGPIEKFLSIFADVRAGEGLGVILLSVNIFLLLAGYSLLKPARDGLILTELGPLEKAYASVAQAMLLLFVVPAYGWLATKMPRVRLILTTTAVVVVNLFMFNLAGVSGMRIGLPFYIWIGLVNVFLVSQFWQFANDLYTEGQGRRLFPMIGIGASLGAWVGAAAVPQLIKQAGFSPYTLLIAGAVVFVLAVLLTVAANRLVTRQSDPEAKQAEALPLGKAGGFQMVLNDRYLFWIAVLTLLLNLVNSTGGFLLDKLVVADSIARYGIGPETEAVRKSFNTVFYGSFNATVNLVGFLVQLFVTSRVMRYMGVRGALFILPVLALVNYSIIAVAPILAIVRVGKILENSTDYSIQNTIRPTLFLPTTREAKYKAKAAIDTFFTRFGDFIFGLLVYAGDKLAIALSAFAWLNVAFTVLWLFAAGRVAREHKKRTV